MPPEGLTGKPPRRQHQLSVQTVPPGHDIDRRDGRVGWRTRCKIPFRWHQYNPLKAMAIQLLISATEYMFWGSLITPSRSPARNSRTACILKDFPTNTSNSSMMFSWRISFRYLISRRESRDSPASVDACLIFLMAIFRPVAFS